MVTQLVESSTYTHLEKKKKKNVTLCQTVISQKFIARDSKKKKSNLYVYNIESTCVYELIPEEM